MENLISVVVCTYNQESTIARTLDSILMQQCHVPYEIIIGEDCSTDGTLTICKSYASKYPDKIRLLANKENKGVQNNYFDCILASNGRYIADCAGDDFWIDPLKLEKEVTIFEQHPQVSMVITNWNFYNDRTHQVEPGHQKKLAPITPGCDLLEAFITQMGMSVFHLCTSLYRADIFRICHQADPELFRNPVYGVEDLQIACIMAQHGDIAYLPDITMLYSIGHVSLSAQKDDENQFCFLRGVTQLSYDLIERYQLKSSRVSDFFSQRIFALAMHAFRAHNANLFQEVLICEREWQANRTTMTRMVFTVMSNESLWRFALIVRKVFVRLKQVCHRR